MRLTNKIVLALNVYLDALGELPEEVREVIEHVDLAAKSSRFVDVIVCYVVDKGQEDKIRSMISELRTNVDFIMTLGQSQKLPMIGDILNTANQVCNDNDYVCYINSDIIVQYWFFDFLASSIRTHSKNTGFIINRKDILSPNFSFNEDTGYLDMVYHPGFDCFIFPKHILSTSYFGRCTVGFPPIGALLATNMLVNLVDVKLINESVVTLHRGDGREAHWRHKTKEIEKNFQFAFEGIDELVKHMKNKGLNEIKTLSFSGNFIRKYMISRGLNFQ